ncbi:TPA: hypothetical protein ACH3X2_013098 [Trebouxia sp. C0005]
MWSHTWYCVLAHQIENVVDSCTASLEFLIFVRISTHRISSVLPCTVYSKGGSAFLSTTDGIYNHSVTNSPVDSVFSVETPLSCICVVPGSLHALVIELLGLRIAALWCKVKQVILCHGSSTVHMYASLQGE